MKKALLSLSLCCIFFFRVQAQITNNGQVVHLENDALVFVDGDYTHSDGEISGAGNIEIKGNWTNTSSGNVFRNAEGLVTLSGSDQFVRGNKTVFPGLRLLGNGIKTTETDVDVSIGLYLEDQHLDIKRYSLAILSPDVNAIKRTSGSIITDDGGFLLRNTNSSSSYLFPLGSLKVNTAFTNELSPLYRPVLFEPENSLNNTFSASLNNFNPNSLYPRNNKQADIESISDKYFYLLNHDRGVSKFGVRFYQNTVVENNSVIVNWNMSSAIWEKLQTSLKDGVFGDGLNKSLAASLPAATNNLPVSFGSSSTLNNPFTFYNAFSPDGDGKNDTWQIKNIELYPDNNLTVFNRWGDEVYKTSNYSNGKAWDGSNLQSGTYFYILNVKINGQNRTFKGFITMVKKN